MPKKKPPTVAERREVLGKALRKHRKKKRLLRRCLYSGCWKRATGGKVYCDGHSSSRNRGAGK